MMIMVEKPISACFSVRAAGSLLAEAASHERTNGFLGGCMGFGSVWTWWWWQ
jgi:hypothetical protein